MQNGLTPYDKKAYRDSKRRRKQAIRAEYTGRITPIRRRKKLTVVIISILTVVLAAAIILFLFFFRSDKNYNKSIVPDKVDNSLLLQIISRKNPVDANYVPNTFVCGSISVNSAAYESLNDMLEDALSVGSNLEILRGYTSYDEQGQLYSQKLAELTDTGEYTFVRAEAEVQKTVQRAGESEFQTGMLIEFNSDNSSAMSYLERNCFRFGFILRYPSDKEEITGVSYSSSIYRYVGIENAVNMRTLNMCLEEYIDYLEEQKQN